MKKVLIIAAHPDDVEFGMGGTVAKMSPTHNVSVYILCNGNRPGGDKSVEENRREALLKNKDLLGIDTLNQYVFNDVTLDTLSHLHLTKYVNSLVLETKPDIVFTNSRDDLHKDHQLVSEAVRVACRPRPTSTVKQLYEFSIPGSSEWNFQNTNYSLFSNIDNTAHIKYECIENYETEVQKFPDILSIKKIKIRDAYYGGIVGCEYAEPFKTIYNII